MNLFIKQKQTHIENRLMATKRERGGEINWEQGINRCILACKKQITGISVEHRELDSTSCSKL